MIEIFEPQHFAILTQAQKDAWYKFRLFVGSHPYADSLGYLHFTNEKALEEFKRTKYFVERSENYD
jgi:hypothetical protein